ncbi:MAG: Flp pilus assembly protein CpaB [Tepidisphaeraceae bacterium]|jgi:pilus assembly protein CpaB
MNWKKAAPLVIALVLGLFAAKMAWNLIANKNAAKNEVKRPQVVVAKQDIEAGDTLSADNTETVEVSTDVLPDNVFRSVAEIDGRVATVPLIQGQTITQTLLAPKGAMPGLTAVIPPGFRAVTLEINEFSGIAGYITPGCHIDVVQTLRDERTGEFSARTIVQNVRVTAVGMKHNPGDPPDSSTRSVTLLVTPEQAEILDLAASNGRPRLTLRNMNDLSPVPSGGVSLADLNGGENGRRDEVAKINAEAAKASQVAVAQQVAQGQAPATRPTFDNDWTVKVIRGDAESEVQFNLHRASDLDAHTDTQLLSK